MQKSDTCATNFKDNSSAKCSFNPALIKGFLLSLESNYKMPLVELDETSIKTKISERELYLVKGFSDVSENEVSTTVTAQTNYGYTVVTSNDTNVKITYSLPYSQCQFRALQSWSNVNVTAFPIDANGNIGGTLVLEDDNTYSLRGQASKFIVPKALPMKFNVSDIVAAPFIWIADDITIDSFDLLGVDLEDLDGIISINMAVTNPTTGGFTLEVTAGCNGTGIEGLDSDFVVLDSVGAAVSTTFTDDDNGVYTATATLTTGTYSVNLSSDVVEVGDNFYSALDTAATFEVA